MEVSKHDYKKAKTFVDSYNMGDRLGKNLKQIEGDIYQKRIGDKLRVRFNRVTKEIVSVFYKSNHVSNR